MPYRSTFTAWKGPRVQRLSDLRSLPRWFSMMNIGLAMAGFLGPGRITLGAHLGGIFGGVSPVSPKSVIKNQLDSTS